MPKLYEKLKTTTKKEGDNNVRLVGFNDPNLFTRHQYKSIDDKKTYISWSSLIQGGSNYFFIFEDYFLTQIFDIKNQRFMKINHEEATVKLGYDYQSYFIDKFDRLFYKNQGHIIIYEKSDTYFYQSNKIELDKFHQACDQKIFKVYENYVYFYNYAQGESCLIMDFEKKENVRSFKIEAIAD
jgi:hypothetical protein